MCRSYRILSVPRSPKVLFANRNYSSNSNTRTYQCQRTARVAIRVCDPVFVLNSVGLLALRARGEKGRGAEVSVGLVTKRQRGSRAFQRRCLTSTPRAGTTETSETERS